jgi:KEOPS complex subunit Cgi121
MEDPVYADTAGFEAWIVDMKSGEAQRFVEEVFALAKRAGIEVLVVRGDMVFGEDHLRSALYHAKKAMREGRNSSDSLSMETLLYASGERQLSSAIKKMAIDDAVRSAVVARLEDGELKVEESWIRLPKARNDDASSDLVRFGFSREELDTAGRAAIDLVLERVAAVDVLKR